MKYDALSRYYQDAIQEQVEDNMAEKEFLAEHGVVYVQHTTEFTSVTFEVISETATLQGVEYTKFTIPVDADVHGFEIIEYEYIQEHTLPHPVNLGPGLMQIISLGLFLIILKEAQDQPTHISMT